MCYRLGRTSEFLIYGHGQQRKATIEAVRLLENEESIQNHNACILGEGSNGITSLQHLKDKSRKWLKFVTKVIYFTMLLIMRFCILQVKKLIYLV